MDDFPKLAGNIIVACIVVVVIAFTIATVVGLGSVAAKSADWATSCPATQAEG